MTLTVRLEISRTFEVSAKLDKVFGLLSDIPASVSHFPRVDALVELGDNCYRWEMKKIGVDKHAIQTIYACRYTFSREDGTISWAAVQGEGNGAVNGGWRLSATENGVMCKYNSSGDFDFPLPGLLKLAVSPVVKYEFNSQVDIYVSNLKKTLSQGCVCRQ